MTFGPGGAAQAGSSGASPAVTPTAGSAGTGEAGGSSAGGTTNGGTAGDAAGGQTPAGGGGAGGVAGSDPGGTGGGGGSGGGVDPTQLDKFSFFVTSMAAMQKLSKSADGFGGDLRYGTADGLTGADKICTEIAESSMPGSSAKQWHAFLSTVKGPVHAKDRIGTGPWYDRTGRLVAKDLGSLLQDRPLADTDIREDLPNELGVGNHRPNPNAPPDDNHHTLTGSSPLGMLYTEAGKPGFTCDDWTTSSRDNTATGRPRIGFSWSIAGRTNWISGQTEGGCGAGVTGVGTVNGGSDPRNPIVGSGGGYGGIYCFALTP